MTCTTSTATGKSGICVYIHSAGNNMIEYQFVSIKQAAIDVIKSQPFFKPPELPSGRNQGNDDGVQP